MKLSQNGINLIKEFEGLRLLVYEDAAGYPTVGYGHKLRENEAYLEGITKAQADDLLGADSQIVLAYLESNHPDLTQNQIDALVDFGFNLGIGSLRMMLAHGMDQVPAQIPRWNHVRGKENARLTERRQREVELFRSPEES